MDSIRIFLCYKSMRILSFWSDILLEKISESSLLDIEIRTMFHSYSCGKSQNLAGIFVQILTSHFRWRRLRYASRIKNSKLFRYSNYVHPEQYPPPLLGSVIHTSRSSSDSSQRVSEYTWQSSQHRYSYPLRSSSIGGHSDNYLSSFCLCASYTSV